VSGCADQTRSGKQSEGLGSYNGVIVKFERRRTKGKTPKKQSEHSNINRYENYCNDLGGRIKGESMHGEDPI
jgi:hypothetical protein